MFIYRVRAVMGKRSRGKRLKKQQPRAVKTGSKTQAHSSAPIQAAPSSTPNSSYHDFVMESVEIVSSGHPRAEQLYQFFRERMVRAIAFEPDVYTYEFESPTPTQVALVVNKHRTDANRYTARYFRNRKALEIYDISYNRRLITTSWNWG